MSHLCHGKVRELCQASSSEWDWDAPDLKAGPTSPRDDYAPDLKVGPTYR